MFQLKRIAVAASAGLLAASVLGAGPAPPIPSSIQAGHRELHAALAKALAAGGRTGEAAKEVERLLAPHFKKEEQYALPPLALLSSVAAGKRPANADDIIRLSSRLKQDMPQMLAEHKQISAAAQRLRNAAQDERKPEVAAFADDLREHALEEEQILYPSAILVGEYLKR